MKRVLNSLASLVVDSLETFVIAISVWIILYLFLFQPTQIVGSSMEPNFSTNERVLTEKVTYRFGEPKRGDVIALHAPDAAGCLQGPNCDFFKRIIGLPGESIEVRQGHFYINGTRLDEPYIPNDTRTDTGRFLSNRIVTLGEHEYFVAGDNREHSSDSRTWGPITRHDIVGKAVFLWYPFDKMSVIH